MCSSTRRTRPTVSATKPTERPQPNCTLGSGRGERGVLHPAASLRPGILSCPPCLARGGGGPVRIDLRRGQRAVLDVQRRHAQIHGTVAHPQLPADLHRLNINLGIRFDRFVFQGQDTRNTAARDFWSAGVQPRSPGATTSTCPTRSKQPNQWQPRSASRTPSIRIRSSAAATAGTPKRRMRRSSSTTTCRRTTLPASRRSGTSASRRRRATTCARRSRTTTTSRSRSSSAETCRSSCTLFYRKTQDQIPAVYLDQKTSFVASGLNVGNQTSEGIELAVRQGRLLARRRVGATELHVHQQLHQLHAGSERDDDRRSDQRRDQKPTTPTRRRAAARNATTRQRTRRRRPRRIRLVRQGPSQTRTTTRRLRRYSTPTPTIRRSPPSRPGRGRLQRIRRAVHYDAARAVQTRPARAHPRDPILGRPALRRTGKHAKGSSPTFAPRPSRA